MYGHSAIRVSDPVHNLDLLYNYGTFRFVLPGFLVTFLSGELDYSLGVSRFQRDLAYYRTREGRPVVEQVLLLSRRQRQAVFAFLNENALPENATYRYDFLFDNCSTRVRDVFETVLGDRVDFPPPEMPQQSFRSLIHRYAEPFPFTQLGIDILLGLPTDEPASPREAAFLPDLLADAFDVAVVVQGGQSVPLVSSRETLIWVEGYGRSTPVPWPSIWAWALAGVAGLLTLRDIRRDVDGGRWLDVTWLGLSGLAGLFLLFMWLGTQHHVTRDNLDLLWAFPGHIVPALVLLTNRKPRWMTVYMGLTSTAMAILILGWAFWPEPLNTALLPWVVIVLGRSAVYVRQARKNRPVT
jgi:hypothetical protein